MSCVNSFLLPNKLNTTSLPMVTDSPYLNYSSNIYVKILFITCCTEIFINITVGLT